MPPFHYETGTSTGFRFAMIYIRANLSAAHQNQTDNRTVDYLYANAFITNDSSYTFSREKNRILIPPSMSGISL